MVKSVLEKAVRYASEHSHGELNTAHLLLGLLDHPFSLVGRLLPDLLDVARLREEALKCAAEGERGNNDQGP